ncbi:MAG: galactokinase [Candidatus Rokubacteria bacterium]|nr:galactokinase [Candidatus Rokubacteria bacterium]
MIVTRTPVRIPLGGGGTDLPSYASRHGGFLLSAAIDKYTFITVNPRKLDRLIRASYSQTETVDELDRLQHPLIREALRLVGVDGGIEIASIADVPSGTGLASSASFTIGLLHALHTLKRESVPLVQLAEEACHVELDVLKEPIGKHDQYITALGGITCLEIDRDGGVMASPAAIAPDVLEEFERNILLFYTGRSRSASAVLEGQASASERGEPDVIDRLHRIKAIGYEVKDALESGRLRRFGELMHEHWVTKRGLSERVSTTELDRWYATARDSGALGGKLLGAGGGGFFMFYCEHEAKPALRDAMAREGLVEMRFRFDFEGSKVLANV